MTVQPEGATPAIETSHPFMPRDQLAVSVRGTMQQPNPFLCADCGLAEAAHAETTTEGR